MVHVIVLADKCLYECGNDVPEKEIIDTGDKGYTSRDEIIEELKEQIQSVRRWMGL